MAGPGAGGVHDDGGRVRLAVSDEAGRADGAGDHQGGSQVPAGREGAAVDACGGGGSGARGGGLRRAAGLVGGHFQVGEGAVCECSVRSFEELPENARKYVEYIEKVLGVPIHFIGVGAGRDAVISH